MVKQVLRSGDLVDWPAVLALAQRHRVLPLVAGRIVRLAANHGELVPADPAFLADMRSICAKAKMTEMRFLGQLSTINAAMAEAAISLVVIKGLTLSARAFGELGLRMNRDIDLLVAPDQIHAARAVLEGLGMVMVEPAADTDPQGLAAWLQRSKDLVFYNSATGIIVELHQRLLDNASLDMPWVQSRAVALMLPGAVEVRALAPADEIRYLALHGALHGWSRLKWLLDLLWLTRDWPGEAILQLMPQEADHPFAIATSAAFALGDALFTPGHPRIALPLSWRQRCLVAIYRKVMLGWGDDEIEKTVFGTTLKNLGVYLLLTTWPSIRERLVFDLTANADKTRTFSRHPALATALRLPRWLWRHTVGQHARASPGKLK